MFQQVNHKLVWYMGLMVYFQPYVLVLMDMQLGIFWLKNTHEKSDLSGKFIPFANELVGCKPQPLSG